MRPDRDLAPDERPETGTPLYVHVPFCAAKCHYCDFYSFAATAGDSKGFVPHLLDEAERFAPRSPRSVFVGGGTPTWLSGHELRELFEGLEARTGFRASAGEVTIECNPESLDRAKAELLLELGVTRFSIGVQSLRPELLELFGRVHQVEQSFEAVRAARAAGAERLSVDLIYAAPGEELETWTSDLARIVELGPDHVSAYHLAFEEGTAFERWLRDGTLEERDESSELDFFWATREGLEAAGYRAYEVSNFAPKGEECAHNLNYWANGPYVGLGPSAVSLVGGRRRGHARSLETWARRVRDRPADPFEWEETLSPLSRLGETWWLGLRRTDGVDPAVARATSGFAGPEDPCEAEAEALTREGLLELAGSRYRLTERGLPLADAVARRFLRPE